MFADGKRKEQRTKSTMKEQKRTQNLIIKYKKQKAEFRIIGYCHPKPFYLQKREQNFKEEQTLETYQPTSPLFKKMFTSQFNPR